MSRALTVEEFLILADSATGARGVRQEKPQPFRVTALIALLVGVPVAAGVIGYLVPSAEPTRIALAGAGVASLLFLTFRDRFDFLALHEGQTSITEIVISSSRIVTMRITYALDRRRTRLVQEAVDRVSHLPFSDLLDLTERHILSIIDKRVFVVLRLVRELRREYQQQIGLLEEDRYRRALGFILYEQAGKRGLRLLKMFSGSRTA